MKFLLVFIYLLTNLCLFAQDSELWMYPNKGQWEENIQYQINLHQGKMYLEKNQFTYQFYESFQNHHNNNNKRENSSTSTEKKIIHTHVIKQEFVGANPLNIQGIETSEHYQNYFIGKDTNRWKSKIHATQEITYTNFYENIDLLVDSKNSNLEYSFILKPNADASNLKFRIKGASQISLDASGNLHYSHSFGEIIEQKLIAWNEDATGNKTPIAINFKLNDSTITFELPKGYNKQQKLIIDPQLIFSTFTGSTSDNWGFTATPDEKGNLYAGGISFGVGYPTTTGAYDLTYHGGTPYDYNYNGVSMIIPGIDIAISKFNTDGTKLIYSTYLGGTGNETPHSFIANSNNELYILGATSSTDYPTSVNAYDKTFNGGSTFDNKELTFLGSDIIITKFSEDGTKLLGSTYLGGSEIDGLSDGDLVYNYGDNFRGDINITPTNEILIVSSTQSKDFPIINGFQNQLQGNQDAVVTKLSADLSTIVWSSYFGGSGDESGNSIQTSSNGEVYFTGGSTSTSLPINSNYNGGISDGYVVKLSAGNPTVISGKYIGTSETDQSYFVQLDNEDKVYLFGQTNGNFPITPGKYGIPNSGQFIVQFSNDLNTLNWSTTIGAGTGEIEISPTAFSVSRCADIYITGWGGAVNVQNSKAIYSSANNFPITTDAFQKTTKGDNFYLGVLSKDAEKLKYGSYIGGVNTSYNHVDGGTSRFSKTGGVYHAVCGGCGAQINGFTTTPGVISTTNKSDNCNLAAFKFELNKTKAIAAINSNLTCLGVPIVFSNKSLNASKYLWDFGDGTNSNILEPTHTYTKIGTYTIKLIAIDSTGCMDPDTSNITIKIEGGTTNITEPKISICPNATVKLTANKGDSYHWEPRNQVSDSLSENITTNNLTLSTNFIVTIKQGCYTTVQTFPCNVFPDNIGLTKNQEICRGTRVQLQAGGGSTYNWTPSTYLDNTNNSSVNSTPDSTITYYITVTTQDNCSKKDSVKITVIQPDAKIITKDTVAICQNTSLLLNFAYCSAISISPSVWLSQKSNTIYALSPSTDVDYTLNYTNICGTREEKFHAKLIIPKISAAKDTSICQGGKSIITCKGGVDYVWLNPVSIHYLKNHEVVEVSPKETITYEIKGIDKYKCLDTSYVTINVFANAKVSTDFQYLVHWGEEITLKAQGNSAGTYQWFPSDYLSCTTCQNPIASPTKSLDYEVIFTDKNSCVDSNKVHIIFESSLYVPNTFTPNGDNHNEVFKAEGENITNFQLDIYNRWGENIITLQDINDAWNGTYKGLPCKDGTYTWKLRYVDSFGEEHQKTGHVNLIR